LIQWLFFHTLGDTTDTVVIMATDMATGSAAITATRTTAAITQLHTTAATGGEQLRRLTD